MIYPYTATVEFEFPRGLTQEDAQLFWRCGDRLLDTEARPHTYAYTARYEADGMVTAMMRSTDAIQEILAKRGYPETAELLFVRVDVRMSGARTNAAV